MSNRQLIKPMVRKEGGPDGPSVTQYATVAELIAASEGALAPGYYEVAGVVVTYWNGTEFSNFPIAQPKIQTRTRDYNTTLQFASPNTPTTEPANGGDIDTGTAWVTE